MYLSLGGVATAGVMIMSNQFDGITDQLIQAVTPKDQEVATMADGLQTLDCWLETPHGDNIICMKDVPACFAGWNEGSPPPPRRCTINIQ
jgi:hypothetical protein